MTNEEYYAMLDRAHLCHRCHKEKAFPGRKWCPECLEKKVMNNARQRERVRANPELIQKRQDYARALYHQRKDAGLCTRCGKPATHGTYCYEHYIWMKRQIQKRTQKHRREALDRVNVRDYRRENRLCWFCGAPIEDGNPTKACNACRAKHGNWLQKNNTWTKYGSFKFGRRLYEPTYQSGQTGTRAGGV